MMQGVSRASGMCRGKSREINLEEKRERRRGDERATDGGKVRQSQIEPERKKKSTAERHKKKERGEGGGVEMTFYEITLLFLIRGS